MKAGILKAIGQPLELAEVPIPDCAPDEVLIETRSCGICRTDLHIQDGLAYVPKLPHIPGHEPAGVVAAVGRDVRGVVVGQRVVPQLFVSRRPCEYTRSGQQAQARYIDGILGVTLPGGFAEFFTAPAANVLPLPKEVPYDIGGLTSCAAITAEHAFRKARVAFGQSAVVLGAGGIGLILVQLLASAGVRTIAVAQSAVGRELALKSGAIATLSPEQTDTVEQIRSHAGHSGDGCDVLFEMVGTSQTMALAAACVRRCGRIIVIGEEADHPAIDTITIAQRELEIVGSRNGGHQDALDALDLMARGTIHPPIAQRFPLDGINEALACVRNGQAHGRVIIEISQDPR